MPNIKVEIEGDALDLPQSDLNLTLTYALRDRSGLNTNTGTRSEYSFELPATAQNDNIYNTFWEVGINDPAVQVYRRASIEVDGLPFFSGRAQMKSCTVNADLYGWKGEKYKIAFYGNNVDWVTQLQGKYLYEYNFTTHTYDYTNCLTGWGQLYDLGDDYMYTLIKWKDWTNVTKVDPLESTPALFVRSFIDKIFADLGYTVTSNFFDTDFFKQLIMPIPLPEKYGADFSNDYLNVTVYQPAANVSSSGTAYIFPQQTQTPPVSNPYNIGTGLYTAPYDGYFEVEIRANVVSTLGTWGFSLGATINGSVVPITNGLLNFGIAQSGNRQGSTIANVVYLQAGDTLSGLHVISATDPSTTFEFSMVIRGEAEIKTGVTIDFSYIIPRKWKALDFLRGLAHAFNLIFETNVINQTVVIEPSDSYLYQYRNPQTMQLEQGFYGQSVADKTEYLDLIKGGEIFNSSDRPERYTLSWKYDGNDPTFEALNGNEDLKTLQGRFTFVPDRFKKGEETIENPFFAATLVVADNDIRATTSEKTPLIPIIWSKNFLEEMTTSEANKDIEPRILVSEPLSTQNGGTINISTIGGGTTTSACPCTYMIDYNDSQSNHITLSFGTETVNGVQIIGLLDRFYLNEMIRRQTGKELECYINWSAVDLANLTFTENIRIKGNEFILQEVSGFNVASKRSTKTYLVYDAKGDGTEQSQIESSSIEPRLNT